MGTMTRRLAVALAAAGLLVSVGCAKDETVTSTSTSTPVTASSGGGSGTTEPDEGTDEDKDKGSGEYAEACSTIEEIDQLEGDGDMEQGLALFEQARDAGPEELAGYWDTLSAVFEDMEAVDENDPESVAKIFELLDDPEFLEAAAAIDDFAQEECGLDIDLDPSGESGGGLEPDGPGSEDTIPGGDPTSIDAVQAHIESRFGTEVWYSILDENVSWGSSGVSTVTWTIDLGDEPASAGATATDLVDVCEVMAAYLDTYEDGDVEIEISGPDDAVIVSRQPGESCEAA